MNKSLLFLLFLLTTTLTSSAARVSVGFSGYADGMQFDVTSGTGTTATVGQINGIPGKVLIVDVKDWNQVPEVTVNLPEGITLAQCSSLSARIYIPSYDNGGYPNYKNMRVYINDTQVYTDRNEDGSEAYPFIGNTDQWVTKSYDTSALELTDEMKALNSFKLGIGINNMPDGGGRYIYYVNEFTVSYDLNREPPVIPAEGAYYTGQYRNLFAEAGYDEETVQKRFDDLWATYFEGDDDNERLYYPVNGGDMAYILDVNNNDVRSEGMSYGMMICVQLDKQKEFNALWKWAKTYMQHPESDKEKWGYFAWQCGRDGSQKDGNTASDGEEYFIMSLMFASNRWGDGEGIFNYSKEANRILDVAVNRPKYPAYSDYQPIFDNKEKQVVFVPFARSAVFTDPSYHLPAFYELWSMWADKDNDFYTELAAKSREMWPKFADPNTGLMPDYAEFDGRPKHEGEHGNFCFDAWRCAMNMAIDFAWFKPQGVDYPELLGRQQKFFISKGVDSYHNQYQLNGTEHQYYGGAKEHSPGLVGCNASGTLASSSRDAWKFIDNFVDTAIPTGRYRYYDGCLYYLNWLNCAGRYRIYGPDNNTTGIEPIIADRTAVSVSIAGNRINVNGADSGAYTVTALPSGIIMASGEYTDGSIPFSGLAHGLYIISITSGNNISATIKIKY